LLFVHGERHGSIFQFSECRSSFPSNICWRGCLISHHVLGTFVNNQVGVALCIISGSFLFRWSSCFMSGFVPVPCWFYCCGSVEYFDVEYCITSAVALFAQCCPGYLQSSASMWTLRFIFQPLWWVSLEFWWGLHWTCRLLLVI
jgi:hypothetical protein